MCVQEAERARQWMFQKALPFWAEVGVDRVRGGFHEALGLDGRPLVDGDRRLRVTCRQIYVYSHAATLGYQPGLGVAWDGFEYLTEKGWLGRQGGWARLLTADGRVRDATPELYDHAFALFALGWLHRASGDPRPLAWAHRTLDFLEAQLRHPSAGFLNTRPSRGWRLQNPHMHLLEAALVLYETSGHARFAELAVELATLFSGRFYDPRSATVIEALTDRLARAPGPPGRRAEPGHHFEWAWLLAGYQRLLGEPMAEMARALTAFGERVGVHPVTGATYNAVEADGTLVDGGSRTWPNTERVKAHIALFELDGTDPRGPVAQSTRLLLDVYLAHRPAGTWMDQFDLDGNPIATTIPSATFYHLFVAFAELWRVEPALRAMSQREEGRRDGRVAGPILRAGR